MWTQSKLWATSTTRVRTYRVQPFCTVLAFLTAKWEEQNLPEAWVDLQILSWEDARSAALMTAPYDSCEFYCSSQPGRYRNAAGQPTCCDNIFIPQVRPFKAGVFFMHMAGLWILTELAYSGQCTGIWSTFEAANQFFWLIWVEAQVTVAAKQIVGMLMQSACAGRVHKLCGLWYAGKCSQWLGYLLLTMHLMYLVTLHF